MILVSFFLGYNIVSDEIKICYIFEYQIHENRVFFLLGHLGIVIDGEIFSNFHIS